MGKLFMWLMALPLVSGPIAARAALTPYEINGQRVVSDSTLNVTWADVASPINLTWSPAGAAGSAQAWVASLNAGKFGGFDDWTLPTGDGTFTTSGGGGGYGVGPSTSETKNQLGYLFINELGNTPSSALTNQGPFTALRKTHEYWSASVFTGAAGSAWAFDTPKGLLINHNQSRTFAALAVRAGQVRDGLAL